MYHSHNRTMSENQATSYGHGHPGSQYHSDPINNVVGQMGALNIGTGLPGHMYPAANPSFVYLQDGHLYGIQHPNGMPQALMDHHYPSYPSVPMPHGAIPYPAMMPYTPSRAPGGRVDRDVPGLEEGRRSSYSTNESTPATPFYGTNRENVTIMGVDRSTYNTPSPHNGAGMLGKHQAAGMSDSVIDGLLEKEPAIPKAVPALFTPQSHIKSLEQSLENRIPGNRNVYIRGLHPTTDDELLLKYAERFGKVETSKAIIDAATGACKGFGFAKFCEVADSERCIRGFFRLGYEIGFARESFNSRLKAEGDDNSANLYISNLPRHFTETELSAVFRGYTIMSSKILRDSMGNSRGVGFARFESRDICDEIIRQFNGHTLVDRDGNTSLIMNIRYADTPAQKELKRVTAERRQFRTNEYNLGAYGTPHVGTPGAPGSSFTIAPSYRRPNPPSSTNFSGVYSITTESGQGATGTDRIRSARRHSDCAAVLSTPSPTGNKDVALFAKRTTASIDSVQSSPIKEPLN
ncbi:hypothetical protein BROUX41_004451 [Berkeleyomyces rouxiae]|uniref:uncharacterized protein n=1 Tax=Berkeleyomyces rouxiae TaxID=2035830 RepID=UPI003B76DC73